MLNDGALENMRTRTSSPSQHLQLPKLQESDQPHVLSDNIANVRSCTLSWLAVSVPVLSVHRTSTPAKLSMAVNFCTIASLRARKAAPTAIVVVVTQGKPTGTPMIYM